MRAARTAHRSPCSQASGCSAARPRGPEPQLFTPSNPKGVHAAWRNRRRPSKHVAAAAGSAAGGAGAGSHGSSADSYAGSTDYQSTASAGKHAIRATQELGAASGCAGAPPVQEPPLAAQRGTQPAAAARLDVPPPEQLPRHLAVIMDGNSRWAAARRLPAAVGYHRGVEALRTVVRCCQDWGVPCLTVYAFSAENWQRAAAEVDALLALMERVLRAEVAELAATGVRLRFIGEQERLPPSLQRCMRSAELATADNSQLHLTVALSYSGRRDLTVAVQRIAALAAAGKLAPGEVTPELVEAHLATRQLPHAWRHPDLVVRTSGERRLSNFMCWETAYSELHFSPVMWPDFGEEQLAEALRDFAARERRFGGRRRTAAGATDAQR